MKADELQQDLYVDSMKRLKFTLASRSVMNLTFSGSYALAFLWGVFGLLDGSVTYGMMTAFLQLVGQITRPLVEMSSDIPAILHSTASIDRLLEIEQMPKEEDSEQEFMKGTAGIRVADLKFAYGKNVVFNGFSHDFAPGSKTAIMGPTGVEKSTLIKLLCGLLTTKHGTIEIDGCSPVGRKPSYLSKIYYVPEDFLEPDIKVKDFVNNVKPFYPNFDAELLASLFKELEVDVNRNFTTLSLGQRKRAILAIALAMKTDYLFLDEPTNGLDIPTKALFRKMVAAAMDDKRTIIISTHQVKDVEGLLNHIMMLDKRAVLLDKSVSDIQREYRFEVSASAPADALYVEPGLGGCCSISPNNTGEESIINIELLFNYINYKK
jgi:ABC-2 type transport system ATP-binding protein